MTSEGAVEFMNSDTCRVPKKQRMNKQNDKIYYFVIQEYKLASASEFSFDN